jgi:hypothetical protein
VADVNNFKHIATQAVVHAKGIPGNELAEDVRHHAVTDPDVRTGGN